jgi:predicted nucleic acid-binding protein
MGDGNLIAVSDAGPFIHLAEVNGLAFLNVFARLHVPETVWSEITRQPQIADADISSVSQVKRDELSRSEVAEFVRQNHLLSEFPPYVKDHSTVK